MKPAASDVNDWRLPTHEDGLLAIHELAFVVVRIRVGKLAPALEAAQVMHG